MKSPYYCRLRGIARLAIRATKPLWFALADYVCDNAERKPFGWHAARRAEWWISCLNAWAEHYGICALCSGHEL